MKRHNLEGQQIGYWKVGTLVKKNNKIYYRCTCVCGKEKEVYGSELNTGKSLSCGCMRNVGTGEDLTGRDFGILHVEERIFINNHAYFRCSCQCGGSKIVTGPNLRSGCVTTCGCRIGSGKNIKKGLEEKGYCVNGTYIPGIQRKTLNKNNTSGCRGVSYRADRGKWRAYIRFQRKSIHLGYFDRYEDAVAVRKIAEKEYFEKYL